jgi:16S rRNA (cytidine1402-2'-O)-methyltransferase
MNPGRLFVVATPIGNLGDITFRAIETLKQCPIIACEDTRVSGNLLKKFNISATLIPYHDKNERAQTELLMQKIRGGISIALICDAGTPTISDPGFRIVRECKKKSHRCHSHSRSMRTDNRPFGRRIADPSLHFPRIPRP